MVRVPEKTQSRARIKQPFECLCGCENIFIFVLKRSVNQYHALRFFRSLRKGGKPGHKFGAQLRLRPFHSHLCDRIKIVGGHDSRDRLIVIAANHVAGNGLQFFGDRGRIGTVPDNVAEANGSVPLSGSSREGCIEGCEIGMEIAEDQKSHSKVRKSAHEYSGTSSGMHHGFRVCFANPETDKKDNKANDIDATMSLLPQKYCINLVIIHARLRCYLPRSIASAKSK